MNTPLRPIEYQMFEKTGEAMSTGAAFAWKTYTGKFHAWATEGYNSDMCAVAIVERTDGTIVTPLATKCRFLDI